MSSVLSFVHFLSQICTTFAVKISKQTCCEMIKIYASNKIKEQLLTWTFFYDLGKTRRLSGAKLITGHNQRVEEYVHVQKCQQSMH